MTYTVNYDLTRTQTSGNTTIQISPSAGFDLPQLITVTNGTLSSWDPTTGIAVLSSVNANTQITCECTEPAPTRDNTLMFYVSGQQATPFTLTMQNGKTWDGTLKYYDVANAEWIEWDGSVISGQYDGTKMVLYLRGVGNAIVSGRPRNQFVVTSDQTVFVSGNTEMLLDWVTVNAGQHPTMGDYAFYYLFYQCGGIDSDGLICGGGSLSRNCYERAFSGCSSLTTAPSLPATTLANSCYSGMFNGCSSLTTAPSLPATTLANSCYLGMFYGCSSLTTAPSLPASTLADYCYNSMFNRCTSLTTAPSLPATTLANSCYSQMFSGCSSLTTAPSLPATTLANSCYSQMFSGCSSLTTAPSLPATTLANSCYYNMFFACVGITTVPSLPATTLADSCYNSMFWSCTALTALPALPATTLVNSCYSEMFHGCTKIKLSESSTSVYTNAYRIPSSGTGTTASSAMNGMFSYTRGSFTGNPTINTTYYTSNTIVPANS